MIFKKKFLIGVGILPFRIISYHSQLRAEVRARMANGVQMTITGRCERTLRLRARAPPLFYSGKHGRDGVTRLQSKRNQA